MIFSNFDAFMLIYLKWLENSNILLERLEKVVFHLDEANSDKEAKAIIKNFMLENPTLSRNSNLKILQEREREINFTTSDLNSIKIQNVYLTNELDNNLKNWVKSQKSNSVYTNPDILMKLSSNQEEKYVSIELKSTKKNEIPGSSVQQINPYEWVIFIKQGKPIQVTTGLYLNSITEKVQFPDRSPRPQVAFNTLQKWNKENFIFENNEFRFQITQSEWDSKSKLIHSWKLVLVEQWLKIILDKNITLTNRSPWFNETLIMYANKILDYYESLSNDEKIAFRNKLKSLIKD